MLLFTTLATLVALASAQSGGYQATCGSGDLRSSSSPYYLEAFCGDGQGGIDQTEILLGDCFGNINGNLVYLRNGAFGNSCKNVGKNSGTMLFADCGDGHGGYKATQIDMNNYIGNINGRLVC